MPKVEIIETGKTVDAAIESACEKLGCAREECEWEIIDLPKKGFLGLKNVPAKVRVSAETKSAPVEKVTASIPPAVKEVRQEKATPPPQKPKAPEPVSVREVKPSVADAEPQSAEIDQEKVELAKVYVASILEKMGLEATLDVTCEEGGICINVEGKGLGPIIGRRGETLDAIQYLTSLVANRAEGNYVRITVDCGDYRTKRKDTLEALAKRLAQQVLKTNVSKALEPMNPFERRIIHATVSEIEGVTSLSTGDEPNRRVVITSPTAKPRSGGVRRDFQRSDHRPARNDFKQRESREASAQTGEQRDFRRSSRDSGSYKDRPSPNRDARRDSRRDAKPPQIVKSDGPPKQTPETANSDKPLYTKIDL